MPGSGEWEWGKRVYFAAPTLRVLETTTRSNCGIEVALMNWLQLIRQDVARPFYFYGWREGRYVLEHKGEFKGRAAAQAEALRIAESLGGDAHLHVLDQNHRLVETINSAPRTFGPELS
jgi:hypothetical protein